MRGAILRLAVFPLLRLLYRIDLFGAEQFDDLGACIVIANHCSHLDNALILAALPAARRRRLAIAAAADTIFKRRGNGMLAALLGNAFPVARGGGTARSVEYCRWLIDRGWSVLLYPEGRLTVGGPTQPFRHGIGVIATLAAVPVVPLYIEILRRGVGEGRRLPWRGHVAIHSGAPCRFPAEADADAVVKALEAALARAGTA
ncbi:MAG TPA: lysophospholipid acyltransferase family protein [Dehalococcoidia bacterium]|nr:lysophospholipid acyltransferase family protein [Dehalococcoidia bacterium]